MASIWYADSSALVTFFAIEPESGALLEAISGPSIVTSAVALVEVPRAMGRLGLPHPGASVFARLDIVPLSADVIARAASLPPVTLRSLDAIHIASALSLDTRCDGLFTYDRQVTAAARAAGLSVRSPGLAETP